jgi:hypothetical protein
MPLNKVILKMNGAYLYVLIGLLLYLLIIVYTKLSDFIKICQKSQQNINVKILSWLK